jgi:hypothetical protein
MHTITFFPLGNADCLRIDLESRRQLLFDYAAMRDNDDPDDLRIDLPGRLRGDLAAAKRDYYDVVAFTHLDDDHVRGASEFFWFEHAEKYQAKDRIRIRELWVPAAAITEPGLEDSARVIRDEAKHRLKSGKGIRVFSRPERLKTWFTESNLSLESRLHLITDAGQVVPGFESDAVEFFVHSPFASRQNDNKVEDRNGDALVLHATLTAGGAQTRALLTSDIAFSELEEIVKITKAKGRLDRLRWDVLDIPHHCSYKSLAPDPGKDVTTPVPLVKELYETHGQARGLLICGSKPIPSSDEDPQPPHRPAANYYKTCAQRLDGEFCITMEHPKRDAPEPLIVKIDATGGRIEKALASGVASVVSRPAPRAGCQ